METMGQAMRCHDPLSRRDGAMRGLHPVGRMTPRLKGSGKRKSSDYLLEAPLSRPRDRPLTHALSIAKPAYLHLHVAQEAAAPFAFPGSSHGKLEGFAFAASSSWPGRGIKRCRLGSDVDGPNTATLSRKKRRLRAHLITSRLSQPFSQPATHILNRQGKEVGDKRFLKMATTFDMSRRAVHLQAASYLRYSVMNRLRRRLGVVKQQGSARGGDEDPVHRGMHTSAKAPWQPQSLRSAATERGGERQMEPLAIGDGDLSSSTSTPTTTTTTTTTRTSSTPTTTTTTVVSPAEQSANKSAPSLAKAPACRLSKPIALPLPSADVAATNHLTSPRIDSPPPEPRPPLAWMYEDHEEDGFAFLHLDEDHSGNDDSEHVYCDFDAIFGAKSTATSSPPLSEDHTYEEYVDELDGISWRIR